MLQKLKDASNKLFLFLKLSNQAVGDSIADLLMIEASLSLFNMSIE